MADIAIDPLRRKTLFFERSLDKVRPVKPAARATTIDAMTSALLWLMSKNSISLDGINFKTNQIRKVRFPFNPSPTKKCATFYQPCIPFVEPNASAAALEQQEGSM
ncbi:MAG: hypothetical protein QNL76_12955, partial [Octadecabacter sp.]